MTWAAIGPACEHVTCEHVIWAAIGPTSQLISAGLCFTQRSVPCPVTCNWQVGRQLAVDQMLKRSSVAAAAARKVEGEKAAILKERQDEALKKVMMSGRWQSKLHMRAGAHACCPRLCLPAHLPTCPPAHLPTCPHGHV